MAGVPQKTLAWLYDVLKHEYQQPNRTYSDLAHVLARHPGLTPRTDVYTYEDGASALLVHFKGTIPVNFRGNTYRFPISLWIPHAHPYEPPICYVTPTEDMMIRPGQHVGGDGKIYHPYLAHWRETWERSNVVDFLSILSDVFAKEPPVMSRTPQQQQRPVQPTPPPVPPLPREIQQHQPHLNVHGSSPTAQTGAPPPLPPLPKQPTQGYPPQSPTSPASAYQQHGRYDGPPPLPQSSGGAPSRSQQPYGNGTVQRSASVTNYMPQRTSSLRQSIPPQQQPQPYEHQPQPQLPYRHQPPRPGEPQQFPPNQFPPHFPGPLSSPPGQGYDQGRPPADPYGQRQASLEEPAPQHYPEGQPPVAQPHPQPQPPHAHPPYQQPYQRPYQRPYQYPYQPPYQHPQTQTQTQPPYQQQQQQSQPQPSIKPPRPPTPNLLDSPFDIPLPSATGAPNSSQTSNIPAPPIPRNPEKEALLTHLSHQITQSLHSQIEQSSAALGPLSSQHAAMQSTLQALSAEMNDLQALNATVSSNISLLSTSLAKSDAVISSARKRAQQNDVPRVDEMLVPPTIVARQLYDAACEERGIEAAILALQEGFVRGRIASDVWARRTRDLAREEFKRRWMERKVAKGMGLDLSVYGQE
ncbi:hypothetical protein A1O1_06836 [Capronia coronata CBS 617.96]|uniref:UEV domain-containing protein n=1 Tax=Capronia coronata CBS 617.96 TaxID=1182541 RepID=W9XRL9_9EURO|nr:uncharacterized protein A1O1_06836 [Capronia coronata CBS 617.96]EXJ83217.1 hypothetical protein A1O1_06836 [Capronia coronata CBS 617.96]